MASILILPMALLIALGLTRADFLLTFFQLQKPDGGILFKHQKKPLQLCMVLRLFLSLSQK